MGKKKARHSAFGGKEQGNLALMDSSAQRQKDLKKNQVENASKDTDYSDFMDSKSMKTNAYYQESLDPTEEKQLVNEAEEDFM